MADPIIVPAFGLPVVEEAGIIGGMVSTQEFHNWMAQITEAVNNTPPLTGSGTPEGNIIASVGRWYVDTSAAVGTGIYFKETGDGDTGWAQRS